MKKIFIGVALVAALLSSTTAVAGLLWSTPTTSERITASNNYLTKKVKVGRFDGISTKTSIDVIYTQTSGKQDVEIYAPDNLIDYIEVEVDNGILVARFKAPRTNFSINGSRKIEVRVSAPAVHSFRASSSGDIILKNGLKTSGEVTFRANSSGDIEGGKLVCDDVVIKANSSGDVLLEQLKCTDLHVTANSSGDVAIDHLSCTNVEAHVNSSGDVRLAGTCQRVALSASSSGDLDAKNLKAAKVTARANSSGDVSCYATDILEASTSSRGSIAYRGNPKQTTFSTNKGIYRID